MHDEPTIPLATDGAVRTAVPAASAAWGSFKLVARVGMGGFGEVYRAWDPSLQREVALKLLLAGTLAGDAEYEAVLREARALASVRHPNIVSVYGIDRHDGRVGFWTDFVHGKTLSFLVAEQGRFGAREAALIGLDIARALSAVHRAGLLHRDIKAENVMREEGGRILLMDFGLSTLSQRQEHTAGTPNYMAPELFDGHPSSVASDIYAMGVLLYFLIAGAFPVRINATSPPAVQQAMAKRTPLIDLRPDLPESLLRTISTAMEVDPAKRFTSAGQLASALAESLGTPAPVDTAPVPPLPKRRFRREWIVAAAVLAAALLVGIFTTTGKINTWLHRATNPAAAMRGGTDDRYQKAQELLLHSYKESNVANAIDGFKAVLQAEPDHAMAEARLGQAYFVQYENKNDVKWLSLASEATNRAISLEPDLAVPYITQSRIAATQGKTPEATQLAEKARKLDPNNAEAWGALGDVYSAEGRKPDAMNAYQRAADLAPDDWRWAVNLGIAQYQQGNLKESISQLERAVALANDNAMAFFDLGIAHSAAGQIEEARLDLQRSIDVEPSARAYSQMGTLLMFQGDYDRAVEMEKKAIQLDPGRYSEWANLGDAYLWSGKHHDEAMNAFRKAIELEQARRVTHPQDPDLLATLAEDYAHIGNASSSAVMIRQAKALSSTDPNPSVDYTLAVASEALGHRAEAIPLMARALAAGYGKIEFEKNPTLAGLRADPALASALNAQGTKKN